MARRNASTVLIPVVRERARILAPAIWCCAVLFVGMAGPFGLMPPLWAWVVEWIGIGVLGVWSALHARRKFPDRFVQLASHAQLWIPVTITCIGLYASKQESYAVLLIVLTASSGCLLSRRLTLSTIAGILVITILLVIRADGPFTGVYICGECFAATAAALVHMLMSKAFMRSAELADIADESARELAARLEDLQRAHEERSRLQEQLLHSQRMEAVGTLAAGIAHDMNNVLASISNLGSLLSSEVRSETAREDVQRIMEQAGRGAVLTRSLLAFSRRGQYRKRPIALWDVVRDIVPMLERTLPKSIEIRVDLPMQAVCIEADPTHLEQVLVNLALNARDAMSGSGVLWLRGDVTGEGRARLRIGDTGIGMDEATRLRIFEPFFTTKPLGKGTGLGLSTVWGIVHAHDGTIVVDSQINQGTTFTIELPISAALPIARVVQAATKGDKNGELSGTVLVVDDEEAVRATSKRMLERVGLTVVTAENGVNALEVFERSAAAIRLVILDMGMPVMGGAECFAKLRERTDVPVIIATGYASDAEAQAMVAKGVVVLEKPFTASQLREEVARLLATTRSKGASVSPGLAIRAAATTATLNA